MQPTTLWKDIYSAYNSILRYYIYVIIKDLHAAIQILQYSINEYLQYLCNNQYSLLLTSKEPRIEIPKKGK